MRKTATAERIYIFEFKYFNEFEQFIIQYYLGEEAKKMIVESRIIQEYLCEHKPNKVEMYTTGYWQDGNEDYDSGRIFTVAWDEMFENWISIDTKIQSEILTSLIK